ncbi:MAG TPA: NAD-dependent succinate-semialdehyde dehydrogenase, partial [Acidimicrobiales bacterium]|nr:NAD-dependent succinate-semialdehyde dehydrogenase [Acidimicrobiales bacterium]
VDNNGPMSYVAINPTTGEEVVRFEFHDADEIERRVDRAHDAWLDWRTRSFAERGALMVSAAELLEAELPDVASLLTTEMGKTFASAKGEVAKCALAMRYYAEHAERYLATESIPTAASASGVRYEPLGPVLAIMPWNFPLWQVIRFAAPALMAGNVGLLKHASNVPGAADLLEQLFRRAGFPDGVFTNLFASVEDVAGVIADDRVAAVTLTGSERAGRSVASTAGQHLKKAVLELGGSDAFVVGESADLDRTVPLAVTARIQNNGQSCIASKRFVVVASRAEEFLARFTAAMDAVVMGDPFDPATALGPVVSSAQRDELAGQVADSVAKGATAMTGGSVPDGAGFFYPATVLAGVDPTMRAGCEELFGPVAVVEVADDLDDALRVANGSPWGLGASIWAEDPAEQQRGIAGLEAGMVFVNAIVASTPELPFGGIKRSGYGRELGAHGIHEFTNVKTFFVAAS